MRTSLNEIREHEAYLSGKAEGGELLLYRAQLLVSPRKRLDLLIQEKIVAIIRSYGRKQLRAEIDQIHDELFHHPSHASFREKIRVVVKGNG